MVPIHGMSKMKTNTLLWILCRYPSLTPTSDLKDSMTAIPGGGFLLYTPNLCFD